MEWSFVGWFVPSFVRLLIDRKSIIRSSVVASGPAGRQAGGSRVTKQLRGWRSGGTRGTKLNSSSCALGKWAAALIVPLLPAIPVPLQRLPLFAVLVVLVVVGVSFCRNLLDLPFRFVCPSPTRFPRELACFPACALH